MDMIIDVLTYTKVTDMDRKEQEKVVAIFDLVHLYLKGGLKRKLHIAQYIMHPFVDHLIESVSIFG